MLRLLTGWQQSGYMPFYNRIGLIGYIPEATSR